MAKDILGNVMKVGDKVVFNGMVCDVVEINENRIIGGQHMTGKGVSGIKIPDIMTLSIDLPFDSDKPFNAFVCKVPANNESGDAKPN